MKTKKHIIIIIMFFIVIAPTRLQAADGSSYVYEGYYYDYWGNAQASPAAYTIVDEINLENMEGIKLESVEDVSVSHDHRIFLVDKVDSRVNVFDQELKLLQSIKLIRDSDGKIVLDDHGDQLILMNPSGVYYHNKSDELYIADTEARRVVVLDGNSFELSRIIEKPLGMIGVTEFKPSKITVDHAGRIFIVVQSSYEGIIELNEDGTFSRYYGVNEPKINLIDFFWNSIASDAQKLKMGRTYAPAFNNVTMDSEGFVYAVTYDSAAEDKVFRLNSAGENVLREMGNWDVVGDIRSDIPSKFVDIAVSDYGVYAALDSARGRIFLYNFDGELINVFGSLGNHKGQFKNPTSIEFMGYDLVVTDTELKCTYILSPTKFGDAALKANEKYYYGKWDEAVVLFQEALKYNANYGVAYVGIGKNYLMKDDYESAMYYFELGDSREFYSDAYNGHRGIMIKEYFYIYAIIFTILIAGLIYSEFSYHKKGSEME